MRRVALEANMADLYDHNSLDTSKRTAVVSVQPKSGDVSYPVRLSYLFDKTSCKGQQMVFNVNRDHPSNYYYWETFSTAILGNILGILANFHTVRILLRFAKDDHTERRSNTLQLGGLLRHCDRLSKCLHPIAEAALGPGVYVEVKGEALFYSDCMEYRPRLYLEAKQSEDAKGVGPEEGH